MKKYDWDFIKIKFSEYMKRRNWSARYITGVLRSIERLYDFIIETYGKFDIRAITKEMLEKYEDYLINKDLTSTTICSYFEHIRALFKFLIKEKYILFNPAESLVLPKIEKRLPKNIPTIKRMEKILNMPDIKNSFGLRNRAILELLYSTGIRREEVVKINIYDIDLEDGFLRVQGKGKKERLVPVGKMACDFIRKYLIKVRPELIKDNSERGLFINRYGWRLSHVSIGKLVKRYMLKAGFKYSTHSIRHAFATHLLQRGARIKYIQEMLGHSLISTTQIYTNVVKEELKKVHSRTHPEAKKKNFVKFKLKK